MGRIDVVVVLRYMAYVVSGAAMAIGAMAMMGFLIPKRFPENYRVVFGAVVFLYGAYRFVLTYIRSKELRRNEE